MKLARRLLGHLPRGVELGASSINPFFGLTSWNLDNPAFTTFREAQHHMRGQAAPVHVAGDASALPFVPGSLDYLLASHVIEHLPDCIRTLQEWDRALRVGGVCFLIVPHRDRTIDRYRPRTDLRHLLADYAVGMTTARDPLKPASHYHVWTTDDFVDLIKMLNAQSALDWDIIDVEDRDSKAGNGFTVVSRKRSAVAPPPAPAADTPIAFHQWTMRFPFQVTSRTLETIAATSNREPPSELAPGTYEVTPVHLGFPPFAGEIKRVEVGPPAPVPVIKSMRFDGDEVVFEGQDFLLSTWIEGTEPGGKVHQFLPRFVDGELRLDVRGFQLPPKARVPIVACTLPPGGGRSPVFEFDLP